jgi:hypothetical protein
VDSPLVKKGLFTVLYLITLFNNIVVPCLVVGVIDTLCFYHVFTVPPYVTAQYFFTDCALYGVNGCIETTVFSNTVRYLPPFTYYYQCSASMVTKYAPSFVYMSLISTFVVPLGRYSVYKLLRWLTPGSCLYRALDTVVPAILKPVNKDKIPKMLVNPRQVLVSEINYLGILMTFGAVFPPIAVAMSVTMFSTIFYTRVEVAMIVREALDKNVMKVIEVIDLECLSVGSDTMLLRVLWVLVMLSSLFYTIFLFDILADTDGLSHAYWIFVVVPVCAAMLIGVFYAYTGTYFVRFRSRLPSFYSEKSSSADHSGHSAKNIMHASNLELTTVGKEDSPSWQYDEEDNE